ncbi:MAG: hypothetical protein WAK01_01025 [Methylocystis sp.]
MMQKLTFEISREAAPNVYAIRLVDERQIARILMAEGFAKPFPLKPLRVVYDEGGDEIAPVSGFDDQSAQGRIELAILNSVYRDALARIQEMNVAASTQKFDSGQMQVFHY